MNCIKCECEYTYEVAGLWNCPECGHEWTSESVVAEEKVYRDSNGNILTTGDSVVVIKDLKIKGSSEVIKQGTKIKNIRLVDSDNGHDIDCKINGLGAMQIKSMYVKKS